MTDLKPPFSRSVLVASLPEDGARQYIEGDGSECVAIAQALGLIAVKDFHARFMLTPEKSGSVHVEGTVAATVTQTCSVSLDPFDASVSEPVDVSFMPEAGLARWMADHKLKAQDEPGLADDDPPDAIVDGRIDLGQLAVEFLTLGIDPYPRKPGATFEEGPVEKDPSPFAALARLKSDGRPSE